MRENFLGGREIPFKEQLKECFDNEVTQKSYGVQSEFLHQLVDAVRDRRRIRILYYHSGTWTKSWREIDPKRIYMRERSLYLYSRTVDETQPTGKVFNLNRIHFLSPFAVCHS